MISSSIALQPEKTSPSKIIPFCGNSTFLKFLQFLNAHFPMDLTLDGIKILSNEEQSAKAVLPMVNKPSGKTISLREEHPANLQIALYQRYTS